jgi:hypothetical protein
VGRSATLRASITFGRDRRTRGILISPASPLVPVGIAALAIGFAFGLPAEPPGVSVSEAIQAKNYDPWVSLGSPNNSRGLRAAAVETVFESATENRGRQSEAAAFAAGRASSAEYIPIHPRVSSFAERFDGAFDWHRGRRTAETEEHASDVPPRLADLGGGQAARDAVGQSARDLRPVSTSPPGSLSKQQLRVEGPQDSDSPSDADDHTAIYDIAAHTVHLPNGQRLEAHSGLRGHLDNPRYVSERDRGPTPPNIYDLSLREELFHGIRAIRLNPVGGGDMFGRNGMLAHSYMLGRNGQSNGCVSFRDYPVFLNAFLSGQVNRLIVVEHLSTAPSSQTRMARKGL